MPVVVRRTGCSPLHIFSSGGDRDKVLRGEFKLSFPPLLTTVVTPAGLVKLNNRVGGRSVMQAAVRSLPVRPPPARSRHRHRQPAGELFVRPSNPVLSSIRRRLSVKFSFCNTNHRAQVSKSLPALVLSIAIKRCTVSRRICTMQSVAGGVGLLDV